MTTVNCSLLVLLDPPNQYKAFDGIFHCQSFTRFTKTDQCLQHVSTHLTNYRLLHFFLPQSEHTVIDTNVVFFNTIYYIYCRDEVSVHAMRQQYLTPMFVKIFHVAFLSTYVHQAAITHLVEQAERTKHEPDEYDIALQQAAEHVDALAKELTHHMIVNTRVHPNENG